MKVLCLVFVILSAGTIVSQTPPPPPAYFRPPDADKIARYISIEAAFAADFPGVVTVNQEKVGQFTIRNYQAKTIASTTRLVVYDFGVEAKEVIDRTGFLKDLRSELLRPRGASMVRDSKLSDSVHEFVTSSGDGFVRESTRIVFADRRIYRLSVDVTNWHIYRDDTKLDFEREVGRFFSSFRHGDNLETVKIPAESEDSDDVRLDMSPKIGQTSGSGFSLPGTEWKTFNYDNGRFEILLPAEPELEVEPIEFGIIKTDLYTYTSEGVNQIFMFGFVNFGYNIQGTAEVSGVLDSWQAGLVEGLPDAKVSSSDVKLNGYPSRHVVAQNEILRMEAYAYVIDGRMIQTAVAAPVNESDELKEINRSDSKKFFDSFVYTGSTETEKPPAGMFLRMETDQERLFNDEATGIGIVLPKSWSLIGNKGNLSKVGGNVLLDEKTNALGRKTVRDSSGKTELLFTVIGFDSENGTRATLACGLESVPTFSTKIIARGSYRNFTTNLGYKPVSAPAYKTVNGTGFYVFEMSREVKGDFIRQRIYMRKHKGKMLEFVFTWSENGLLKEMETSLETLTIKK